MVCESRLSRCGGRRRLYKREERSHLGGPLKNRWRKRRGGEPDRQRHRSEPGAGLQETEGMNGGGGSLYLQGWGFDFSAVVSGQVAEQGGGTDKDQCGRRASQA